MPRIKRSTILLSGMLSILLITVILTLTLTPLGSEIPVSATLGLILMAFGLMFAIKYIRERHQAHSFYLMAEALFHLGSGSFYLIWRETDPEIFRTTIGAWSIITGLFILNAARLLDPEKLNTVVYLSVGIPVPLSGLAILVDPFNSRRIILVLTGVIFFLYLIYAMIRITRQQPPKQTGQFINTPNHE